jgi:hypothetical protein
MIYHGSYSAIINMNTDILWQPLSYPISKYSVFGYVMFGIGSVDDVNWHEIRLTITGQALPTIYLHYVLQSTQPADNATDKYFEAYKDSGPWSATNFVLINNLADKGISQYLGGTVTNVTCQEGGVCGTVYDSLYLTEYDPFGNPAPNAIVNGGFEFQNLTGWTSVGTPPVVDYDRNHVYEGFFSAYNHHSYESFYQSLNLTISNDTNFSGAIFATVSVNDTAWHEIMLTINETRSEAVYLHYRVQTSQPNDTATDKYFLIGNTTEKWYGLQRNIFNDLVARGLSPGSNWTVTSVTCQQQGISCTAYDALRLTPARPTIDQPLDLTYLFNATGNSITWHPTSQIPDHYTISVNGGSTSRSWNGGAITYSVDGFLMGTYYIRCTVYDALGRAASSRVTLTVQPPVQPSTAIQGTVIIIVAGAVALIAVVLAIDVVVMRKRKR